MTAKNDRAAPRYESPGALVLPLAVAAAAIRRGS